MAASSTPPTIKSTPKITKPYAGATVDATFDVEFTAESAGQVTYNVHFITGIPNAPEKETPLVAIVLVCDLGGPCHGGSITGVQAPAPSSFFLVLCDENDVVLDAILLKRY